MPQSDRIELATEQSSSMPGQAPGNSGDASIVLGDHENPSVQENIKTITKHQAWLRDLLHQARVERKKRLDFLAELQGQNRDDIAMEEDRIKYDESLSNAIKAEKFQRARVARLKALLQTEADRLEEANQTEIALAQESALESTDVDEAGRLRILHRRQEERRRLIRRGVFIFSVLAPAVFTLLYCLFFFSPMYVSEAGFAVRSAESVASTSMDIASVFLKNPTANNDIYILEDYIKSLDLAQRVDTAVGIRKHYASSDRDIISRLWRESTQDELLSYWNWIVKPELDADTGIITLKVKAYSPEMAQKLSQAVLTSSEELVNAMNERAQLDAIKLAQKEIERAEERVRSSQEALRTFRDTHTMLDPKATAAGLQGLVTQLEGEATGLRTQITEAQSYMQSSAPALRQLRQRLAAVEKQLLEEKQRVAGQAQPQSNLSSIVADYEDLMLEADFAQKQLVSAMTSLEQARIQQSSQSRYVVAYQKPTLPDEALYPKPFIFSLYVLMGTLLILGIVSLIWASIREHAGF